MIRALCKPFPTSHLYRDRDRDGDRDRERNQNKNKTKTKTETKIAIGAIRNGRASGHVSWAYEGGDEPEPYALYFYPQNLG